MMNKSVVVNITADLDCTNKTIFPLGGVSNPFQGTLQGNGHSIKNMNIVSTCLYVGLFGFGLGANVSDLVLVDFNVCFQGMTNETSHTGALFGRCCGNCSLSNVFANTSLATNRNKVNGHTYTGGLVGLLGNPITLNDSSVIFNCSVENTLVYGSNIVGGVAGENDGIMTNCHNLGTGDPSEVIVSAPASAGGKFLPFHSLS